ncbi:MAG: hypothetical protein Q8P23_02595 [bacterium]|nr:hypothetical protein [bacterium]
MPSLKITSLNAGRLLQERTRKYLERLASRDGMPDILCLQDIPVRDLSILTETYPHIAFAPMTNHLINGVRAVVGISIVSRYFMTNIVHHTVWGDGKLKDLQGVNNKNERFPPTKETDDLIDTTEDRVAICVTVIKDGRKYNIATTHGYWVRGGVSNDRQRQSTRKLLAFLHKEAMQRDGLLFVADMNPDRDGEVYRTMVSDIGMDNLHSLMPKSVKTTLDPEHPASKKGIKVVADWICEWPRHDRMFFLSDVRLHSGVSDHCALSATVEIDYGL